MAATDKPLKLDGNNRPIPQFYNPTTDQYEEVQGSGGASFVQLNGNKVQDSLLLNGASATGRGQDQPVSGLKTLTIEVFGTATSFTVQIEGKSTSGTPYVLQATNLNTLTNATNITAAGLYQIDVTGLVSVDANLTAVTGGNVTAQGKLVA